MNLKQYMAERKRWADAGKPMRDESTMLEIYSICKKCELFQEGGGHMPGYDLCSKCGCNLHPSRKTLNKIAWATTKCPDSPPKWRSHG